MQVDVQLKKIYTLTITDVEFDAAIGTILNFTGTETDIEIPSSFIVDGVSVPVVAIADGAFRYNVSASLSS